MNLSFDEVVVLAAVANNDGVFRRSQVADWAVTAFPSPKYSYRAALKQIDDLTVLGYLRVDRSLCYHLTSDGEDALNESFSSIKCLVNVIRKLGAVL